ncbi:MAG: UbiA family prenyltransferase [Ornithinimicrobium sp.]
MTATMTALARGCHPGPTVAVTTLAALLSLAFAATTPQAATVGLAVFSGQLVIGWSNDLLDADRDHHDGRLDKPLAAGDLSRRAVLVALSVAGVLCLVSSLALGWRAGVLHLVGLVGSGLAYNLGLKATAGSFVPYAVAFGSLPAVVWLATRAGPEPSDPGTLPPSWMMLVGALLGVGAHLLNALPDLTEDTGHGIVGLPHRLGPRRTQRLAPVLLLAAVVVAVAGIGGAGRWWGWVVVGLGAGFAVIAARGSGAAPFRAAVGMALLTASLLVLSSRMAAGG